MTQGAKSYLETTDGDFDRICLESDLPVVVDFWAPWCGPCRNLAPIVEKLAEELSGKVRICKHNTDEHPAVPMRYGVKAIPTLLFLKAGEEVHRVVGGMATVGDLKKALRDKCGVSG